MAQQKGEWKRSASEAPQRVPETQDSRVSESSEHSKGFQMIVYRASKRDDRAKQLTPRLVNKLNLETVPKAELKTIKKSLEISEVLEVLEFKGFRWI